VTPRTIVKGYDEKRHSGMTLTITLSDEQATALQAKAVAEGLSVEEWIQKLAEPTPLPRQRIWETIAENIRRVPGEDLAAMPKDGASQIDHYIYGVPKREL
jgi:hypothetical protein